MRGMTTRKEKYTYTTHVQWRRGDYKLGPIPGPPEKQIVLLERAVFELYDWIMEDLGWDNSTSISDRLSDQVNQIAQRAYDRGCSEQIAQREAQRAHDRKHR